MKPVVRLSDDLDTLRSLDYLNTVCEEALCPNRSECFRQKTATFLILGNACTRDCRYCGIGKGRPQEVDESEPQRIQEAAQKLGLKHIVITSVTRDDLLDEGACHFATVIGRLKDYKVETLVPDFNADEKKIKIVLDAKPDVFGHNIETVKRLFPVLRPKADYLRSLAVLKLAKKIADIITKSGLMLGLGENDLEIAETLSSLRDADVDIVTIGQYLQPTSKQIKVVKYYSEKEFTYWKRFAQDLGFKSVSSGALVRSSYHAAEQLKSAKTFYSG